MGYRSIGADACAASRLERRRLAEKQEKPTWITNDDLGVYWATAHELMAIDKKGGLPHRLASGITDPGRIVADGAHVYWLDRGSRRDEGSLARVAITGGPVELLASGFVAGDALAIDSRYVYWGAGDRIVCRAKAGGPDRVLARNVDATAIALDSVHVYWSNADRADFPRLGMSDAEGNQRVLLGGPAPGYALSIQTTSTSVCWTSRANDAGGGIWCMPYDGVVPRHVATGEAWTFAIREETIYWIRATPDGQSELVSTSATGAPSRVLATGSIADVTADIDHVYWTDIKGEVYEEENR